MEENQSWKRSILVAGAMIGAISGLTAAYLYVKKTEELTERPRLTSGEGVKIGLGLVGLLKMITDLGNK
jgi:hypothetical protein